MGGSLGAHATLGGSLLNNTTVLFDNSNGTLGLPTDCIICCLTSWSASMSINRYFDSFLGASVE